MNELYVYRMALCCLAPFELQLLRRDGEPPRRRPRLSPQAKLQVRRGGVGERLKAILALLFDLAMSFDEPKLMRGGSR